ncbi:hypothetical protein [Tahibacter amnicola]|uniref:DUF2059 domain-containing protein n=1 Tax=Tahibacter amnicola TaxID=2976241 RepID=A0ABY6BJS2_9GAMM|nr:hypothetical protein [Tahibacter amnicola]UXI70110.1 hypothetical protein N4264_10915 [Tahibacter amnicola]
MRSIRSSLVGVWLLLTATTGVLVASEAGAAGRPGAGEPIAEAAQAQSLRYRQQLVRRLAGSHTRDELIVAVMLGMPRNGETGTVDGYQEASARLARSRPDDALAAYVLAVGCQEASACAVPSHGAVARLEPANAVHWLVNPAGTTLDAAALAQAAQAQYADSHLDTLIDMIRTVLDGEPAPEAVVGADPVAVARRLRRDAAERVLVPRLGSVLTLCRDAAGALREDCMRVGRHLFADRSGSVLTRMIGSVLLRRLVPGTEEAVRALAFRRNYTWLAEKVSVRSADVLDRVQDEMAEVGEWEALQRSAERMGWSRTPPIGWQPADPNVLLLPEERPVPPTVQ